MLWLSPATVPRTETERGEKGGKKAEKVAEFCEKAGNNCAKVPMFSRICFAKPSTILRLCMQLVDDRGETTVDHLRTKKNLPLLRGTQ